MSILVRILIIGALMLLATALFIEAGKLSSVEVPDPSKVALLFVLIIFVTIAIGGMVALSLAPSIGERIGGFFFNPNEEIEKDIHTDAIAAVNRGDWEEAITEFVKILKDEPMDSVSINDIVHLYTDKLEDPHRAIQFLEAQLESEWPPDHSAFLAGRLVDVYWGSLHDAERARQILVQIAETMPDTRHAANAQHRLREIELGLANDEVDEPLFLRPTDTAQGPSEDAEEDPVEEMVEAEEPPPEEGEARQS